MKRIYTLDSLKFMAICAVFVIHFAIFRSFQGIEENTVYLSFNILARFAVPVFFVIAGYLFCQRTQSKAVVPYAKSYLIKLLMMYLVWTFIYHMVFGMQANIWHPIDLAGSLYYGTVGLEILWFLPALIYSVIALTVAIKFNQTRALFIVATLLHIIGLSQQSYRPLLPESLQLLDANFRDPAFFGLFYVLLGYQLVKEKWIEMLLTISKNMHFWVVITIISACLMVLEGLYLIQYHAGPIGEYYLFTPLLTLAMLMVALTISSNDKSSLFSKLGSYSGDIYLNHGLGMLTYWPLLFSLGYLTEVNKAAIITNSVAYQTLLVPIMMLITFTLYFVLKRVIGFICNANAIKHYKDLVMFSGGYWIVFFAANTAQEVPLFNHHSGLTITLSGVVFVASYLVLANLIASSQQANFNVKLSLISSAILAILPIVFAVLGGFEWLGSQQLEEGSQLAIYFSRPFFYYVIYYTVFCTFNIWLLDKIEKQTTSHG